MNLIPVRVQPGEDLRSFLDRYVFPSGEASGFVVAGLGSLQDAKLRFAAQDEASIVKGPSELLSISGSISANGCHVHVVLSTDQGQVLGGHLCHGSMVRTTAEMLLAATAGYSLTREIDSQTGYPELSIHVRPPHPHDMDQPLGPADAQR